MIREGRTHGSEESRLVRAWINGVWECNTCGCVVELTEMDQPRPIQSEYGIKQVELRCPTEARYRIFTKMEGSNDAE